ncbi:MAG: WbqC-like family protein, partial [Parcubacteria group bacterium Gr01-1014_70]
MIIACHQPNYLPHLGFFHKMKEADVFVLLDSVQFSDGFYQHRNRIRVNNGWKWLTIPVERTFQHIQNVKIKQHVQLAGRPWHMYHWDMIQHAYAKTPFFTQHALALEAIFHSGYSFEHLADFTIECITHLKNIAGITTPLVRSSTL